MRATANPVLRFDRVSKAFQGQIVLNDLTLEMQQGEFLTLLGPRAAAKPLRLILSPGLSSRTGARSFCAASRSMHCRRGDAVLAWCFSPGRLFPT